MVRTALLRLLDGRKPSVVERWRRHSLATGVIAKRITDALKDVDGDRIVAGALLHDVGRELSCGVLHGWFGYLLLRPDRRLRDCARFCVTHWLKGRTQEEIRKSGDLSENLIQTILAAENFEKLSLEDMVVCVADAMAQGDLLVDVESRYADARTRYGDSVWISENLRRTLDFKKHLDGIIGRDIRSLFSEFGTSIVDDALLRRIE